jgi:hypothetical protein
MKRRTGAPLDGSRFDQLTRGFTYRKSRRGVLTGLGAAAAAGVFGRFRGGAEARSVCRPEGVVCSKNADCCGGACAPKDNTGRRFCAPIICLPDGASCDPQYAGACCSGLCAEDDIVLACTFDFCCYSDRLPGG